MRVSSTGIRNGQAAEPCEREDQGGKATPEHDRHPDGATRGGHLLTWQVWPTLEVIIREPPAGLRKTYRPEPGVALIDLGRP